MAKQSYSYSYGIDKTYCYPNGTLKNKFNIMNADELAELERQVTNAHVSEFKDNQNKALDFNYLKFIHKNLFSEIYSWAGKVRTVDIAKGTLFCRTFAIEAEAARIFSELQNDNWLLTCPNKLMYKKLSYYLSEINALHPFREGNGRTQRLFIKIVANRADYELDFSGVSQELMVQASAEAFLQNYDIMDSIIKKSLRKI